MATCKDCIHYEVCKTEKGSTVFYREGLLSSTYDQVDKICGALFKDRSRFVELPCNFGDVVYHYCDKLHKILDYTVYCVNVFGKDAMYRADSYDENDCEVMEALDDSEIGFEPEDCQIEFESEDIGKVVFLTREEAKQALKEREDNV